MEGTRRAVAGLQGRQRAQRGVAAAAAAAAAACRRKGQQALADAASRSGESGSTTDGQQRAVDICLSAVPHLLGRLLDLAADDELVQYAVHLRQAKTGWDSWACVSAGWDCNWLATAPASKAARPQHRAEVPSPSSLPRLLASAGPPASHKQAPRALWKPNTRSSSHTLPK